MRYMLDTNIISYLKNKRSPEVAARFASHDPSELCISSITLSELVYGAYKSSSPEHNMRQIAAVAARIATLPFTSVAAYDAGQIRAELERLGQVIGAYDMQIAAHARSAGLVLVTHNTSEFSRVPNLQIEDWTVLS